MGTGPSARSSVLTAFRTPNGRCFFFLEQAVKHERELGKKRGPLQRLYLNPRLSKDELMLIALDPFRTCALIESAETIWWGEGSTKHGKRREDRADEGADEGDLETRQARAP